MPVPTLSSMIFRPSESCQMLPDLYLFDTCNFNIYQFLGYHDNSERPLAAIIEACPELAQRLISQVAIPKDLIFIYMWGKFSRYVNQNYDFHPETRTFSPKGNNTIHADLWEITYEMPIRNNKTLVYLTGVHSNNSRERTPNNMFKCFSRGEGFYNDLYNLGIPNDTTVIRPIYPERAPRSRSPFNKPGQYPLTGPSKKYFSHQITNPK